MQAINYSTAIFNNLTTKQVRDKVYIHYRNNLQGTTVVNFLIKCKINGRIKKFICGVVVRATGKFQYSLYHCVIRKYS
ncbi:MAG: hypothetical protein IT251_04770 [Chitinophagaceae bacterium]|nr:hypothetical protein [Chitinophagaceae bacterium]